MHRQIAHPVRFWHRQKDRKHAHTPSEDAGSRTRGADDENGSVSSLFHFSRSLLAWLPAHPETSYAPSYRRGTTSLEICQSRKGYLEIVHVFVRKISIRHHNLEL